MPPPALGPGYVQNLQRYALIPWISTLRCANILSPGAYNPTPTQHVKPVEISPSYHYGPSAGAYKFFFMGTSWFDALKTALNVKCVCAFLAADSMVAAGELSGINGLDWTPW